MDPVALARYERFVLARHDVWVKRQEGAPQPWTDDPVIQRRKFCNMFRVLDRGSQFAVALMSEEDLTMDEALARAVLYRYTNLPSAWAEAFLHLGARYPRLEDMRNGSLERIWTRWREMGARVFSGAYVILPQPNRKGDKVAQAIELAVRVAEESTADFVLAGLEDAPAEQHALLMGHYGIGSFMAMQILTDWGYRPDAVDQENTFVAEGPGSVRGAAILDPKRHPVDVIAELRARWLDHPLEPVVFLPGGGTRSLSLMDVQNTLCEFDKYDRYWSGRKPLPANEYRPANPGAQPRPIYPAHWA